MYTARSYQDAFEMYEVRDSETGCWFKIAPERGAIVTSLGLAGKELLYLDEVTFRDKHANVRGGIPILFPIAGQLEGGKYTLDGQSLTMANHGVARTSAWTVRGVSEEASRGAITLQLESSPVTRQSYPFDFELLFDFVLENETFTIDQRYRNRSDQPMPMYAGFHPYFRSAQKKLHYITDASKYLDYNDMNVYEFDGVVDMERRVESIVFLDATKPRIAFEVPEASIELSYGSEFKYVVLWSVAGRDFICVEPWMAKNQAFNTGEGLVYVEPGAELRTHVSIRRQS
ncbi:aldose epimerase [Alicyclobacillus fastidiosus]|uniref:Aldose epimerase n=1 Tax=Alicyclobacillus fastidiosus TaxID=392011 RepID=A0ABY6ZQG0_9BACL|nr:aldose epimerase [Alicyclobacillus fastidiosus]WAH44195.1 aldose epimerase [Alicyclobacillus fastidiosus]GMA60511.1 hypothetical protein GCM10025859_09510 [Alicyclobacillus fastidiosus]